MLNALAAGYERIVAWADILDRINVYPIPDGDTGRNLVTTLGVLKNCSPSPGLLIRKIQLSARGNSGNIFARFLAGFLPLEDLESLSLLAKAGRDMAYQAVPYPQQGTMLTVCDTLVTSLEMNPPEHSGLWVKKVIKDLEEAVKTTATQLPELKKAGVVDAGALGMLVFLDPLLITLAGGTVGPSSFIENLRDTINLSADWQDRPCQGYCLDVVLKVERGGDEVMRHLLGMGESQVFMAEGECLKVHLHAPDRGLAREDLAAIGTIVSWSEDDLAEQTLRFRESRKSQSIHIMTDAAGSLTREMAKSSGITLLNSYINMDQLCLPEAYVDPAQLFSAMRNGVKVSTSQASDAERCECYDTIMKVNKRVLYLCVGSFYTGNYQAALRWKTEHDTEDRMTIIDTGVASGKLGLVAKTAAELALIGTEPTEIIAFARKAIKEVQEYIFLDKLHFLTAGGRMSKTGAFFGDVFHIKPIVSPFQDGVRKVGVARSLQDQVRLAFRYLEQDIPRDKGVELLLEYSDNRDWIENDIKPKIERAFPQVKVTLQLLSLTTSAHTGPGSWGVAFLPLNNGKDDAGI